MVFDDITELVSAQRVEAWSEVARRLAHEIKNPLTPIQLSAERLQQKLGGKLDGADQGMLERSVTTIVNQVQAMKTLVNEFRDYARLPASSFDALDLNALVVEVLGLYGAAQESGRLSRRARRGAAGDRRRRHPAAPGDPQPGAERARRGRRAGRRPGAHRHRGGAQRERRGARGAPASSSTMGPGSPRRCSSAPSSPTSRPRRRAPASAWRWSRRSPTSTARAFASPTSARRPRPPATPRRTACAGAQVSLSFSKLATTVRVAANEPVADVAGALRVHGHHSCRRRRTGHPGPAVGDPRRRRPHDRAGGERGAGARLPRAHPPRPRPARHLDARRRRHHAAQGVGLDRAADDAGDHDERPRHDRHRGRGDQVRRDGLPGKADHAAEAAARRRAGPGQAAVARAGGAQRGAERQRRPHRRSGDDRRHDAAARRRRCSARSPSRASTSTGRCARRATRSRRATSSSTSRRRTAA